MRLYHWFYRPVNVLCKSRIFWRINEYSRRVLYYYHWCSVICLSILSQRIIEFRVQIHLSGCAMCTIWRVAEPPVAACRICISPINIDQIAQKIIMRCVRKRERAREWKRRRKINSAGGMFIFIILRAATCPIKHNEKPISSRFKSFRWCVPVFCFPLSLSLCVCVCGTHPISLFTLFYSSIYFIFFFILFVARCRLLLI